jgi:hypothetical protein
LYTGSQKDPERSAGADQELNPKECFFLTDNIPVLLGFAWIEHVLLCWSWQAHRGADPQSEAAAE